MFLATSLPQEDSLILEFHFQAAFRLLIGPASAAHVSLCDLYHSQLQELEVNTSRYLCGTLRPHNKPHTP